jgi:penicillin-binding protein 1B
MFFKKATPPRTRTKNTRASDARPPSAPKKRPLWRRIFRWTLAIVILIPSISYTLSVDAEVRQQFEGKRWALPARVFARPLELYPGMRLNPKDFKYELENLEYHEQEEKPQQSGEFYRKGSDFYLVTRSFKFWDNEEPVRKIRVRFDGNKIETIADLDTREYLNLTRLDPVLIGKIYPTHKEDRVLAKLNEVPPHLIKALLSMEDRYFYEHNGISLRGLGRAMFVNLKSMSWSQGGSTLTQQLIKNHFLTSEKTIHRKLKEALMALLLEVHYSKNEILEAYLNEVYLGQEGDYGIHGMGLAAQFYFNRPLNQLTLPQAALLIGLVRGASKYNPRRYPDRAVERRNLVLSQMFAQGMISKEQHDQARSAPLDVSEEAPKSSSPYPAFLELVRRQLKRDYKEQDLQSEGLQIFTTLDPIRQNQAEKALTVQVKKLERDHGHLRGRLDSAVIATAPSSGEILALVGGKNTEYEGFNRALDALRPIGSLIKPAIYLTALENSRKYSLISPLSDRSFDWKIKETKQIWSPRNYDGKEHGTVTLMKAMMNSYNLAAVQLGRQLGLDKVKETLFRLGIERELASYPSMLLGSIALTPMEVTQMYQTIASGGSRTPLRAIREVTAHDGKPLARYPLNSEQAFDAASMFVLSHGMQNVVRYGTGRAVADEMLPDEWRLAGKTGTTNEYRDSWFAGFGGDMLAVVWMGRDDNKSTGLTGGGGAMRVWGEFMKNARPQSLTEQLPERTEWRYVGARAAGLPAKVGRAKIPIIINHERDSETVKAALAAAEENASSNSNNDAEDDSSE